jgi:hypothetical protein
LEVMPNDSNNCWKCLSTGTVKTVMSLFSFDPSTHIY